MEKIDPQMDVAERPMIPSFLECYAIWEVLFDFTKANPLQDKPENVAVEQALFYPPEIQAKHPCERMTTMYKKVPRSPNFMMTSGNIRKRKSRKYGIKKSDSTVSACSDCLTIFCGAKPASELGHSISLDFTSNIRSNSTTDADKLVYQRALCKLAREGGWASSKTVEHKLPLFRLVNAKYNHSTRYIDATNTCPFAENASPVRHHIERSDHTLEEPVIKLLESIFKQ
jgi:hypothetical protein